MKQRSKVDEVMAIVRPPEREAECRRAILQSLRMIESAPTAPTTPGQLKRKLLAYAAALRKARAAIADFDQHPGLLSGDQLLRSARVATHQAELIEVKRSGGSQAERALAVRKRLAAESAFDLILNWGRRMPSLTKDGKAAEFYSLAALLLKLSCGQKHTADLERACKQFFDELESDGFPDAAARARLRKMPPVRNFPDYMKTNSRK